MLSYESKNLNCKKQNIPNSRTAGLVISIIFFWFRISANNLKIVLKVLLLLF